jgi:hypothetical protein
MKRIKNQGGRKKCLKFEMPKMPKIEKNNGAEKNGNKNEGKKAR